MKKIWYFLKPIVYSYTVQYLFIIIGISIFSFVSNNVNIFNSEDYIYKYTVIGMVISTIPIVIYLYNKYKIKESKIKLNKLLLMVPLGLSISLFYNMLTIKFQMSATIDLNIILLVLYLVIFAPLFEEFVFRYIALRKARENFSDKKAIILVSIVFALMHSGILNIIYAFLIGVVLSYVYIKYKNIVYPLVLHISANLMSVCITDFNLIALVASLLVLVIMTIYLKKQNHI